MDPRRNRTQTPPPPRHRRHIHTLHCCSFPGNQSRYCPDGLQLSSSAKGLVGIVSLLEFHIMIANQVVKPYLIQPIIRRKQPLALLTEMVVIPIATMLEPCFVVLEPSVTTVGAVRHSRGLSKAEHSSAQLSTGSLIVWRYVNC